MLIEPRNRSEQSEQTVIFLATPQFTKQTH